MSGKVVKDEELMSLKLDRPGRVKSQEQLAKHTVDSQFEDKPIERSVYLLTKGDDVQKVSIVQNLPQLYQFEPNATVNRILPKIQQELAGSSSEFNIAAARIFQTLIQKKVPVNLLSSILLGIESRDPLVATTWIETLLEVINYLSDTQIRNEVLKWAVQKSASNKPTLYRVASCHLLGRCAVHPKIQSIEVKTTILPLVQGLAQDVSFEVRACIAGQLPNIAQGLNDTNVVKSTLLPNVVELAKDTNGIVRSSAIVAVAQLLPLLTADTKQEVIAPLFKELCNQVSEESDAFSPVLAREFGKYLMGLHGVLGQIDCLWFLKFYRTLSIRGLGSSQGDNVDPTQGVYCRHFCAQNLPQVTTFTLIRLSNSLDTWHTIYRDLAADPCYIVRKSVAGCIHEVVGILGVHCKLIKPDIVRLLRDDAEDVLHMVVPKLGLTLELLSHYGLLSKEMTSQISLEVGRAVLKCHMELSKGVNWRMQSDLLAQFEHLPNCLPSDFIHQHFTPVIFAILGDQKAKPVKAQAARLLLIFLRYNIKEIQRKWIRENLMNRLYLSNSCYTRHIFIKMCDSAMSIFSKKYFKEYFFQPLLSLLNDKVSNIRLCTILLLPQLKATLSPDEKNLHQNFDNAVKKLELTEKDKDVLFTLKCTIKTIQAHPEGPKQEAIAEEKLRQDEEAKIAQGKIIQNIKLLEGLPVEGKRVGTDPKGYKNSVPFASQSQFSFLQQHFYTDAGVNLPIKHLPPPILAGPAYSSTLSPDKNKLIFNTIENSTGEMYSDFESLKLTPTQIVDLDGLSEEELKNLEFSTTNITDDVKVNLRRINRNEIQNQSETKRKLLNRRSLSNLSKIPVSKNYQGGNKNNEESTKEIRKSFVGDVETPRRTVSKIRPKSEVLTVTNLGIEFSSIRDTSGDSSQNKIESSKTIIPKTSKTTFSQEKELNIRANFRESKLPVASGVVRNPAPMGH